MAVTRLGVRDHSAPECRVCLRWGHNSLAPFQHGAHSINNGIRGGPSKNREKERGRGGVFMCRMLCVRVCVRVCDVCVFVCACVCLCVRACVCAEVTWV